MVLSGGMGIGVEGVHEHLLVIPCHGFYDGLLVLENGISSNDISWSVLQTQGKHHKG